MTPQILVTDALENVVVPENHVKDGHIVFNIHYNAVSELELGNEFVCFSARFSGKSMQIEVPIEAILAIYARGKMVRAYFFRKMKQTPPPEDGSKTELPVTVQQPNESPSKAHLKLVK